MEKTASDTGTNYYANQKSCPSCKNGNTQKIQMVVMNGTTSSNSFGGGISLGGDIGIGIIGTESTTKMAQSLVPGPAYRHNLGSILLLVAFISVVFFISASCTIMGIEDISKNEMGCLVFILISCGGFFVLFKVCVLAYHFFQEKDAIDEQAFKPKKDLFEFGWICHRCGYKWIP